MSKWVPWESTRLYRGENHSFHEELECAKLNTQTRKYAVFMLVDGMSGCFGVRVVRPNGTHVEKIFKVQDAGVTKSILDWLSQDLIESIPPLNASESE